MWAAAVGVLAGGLAMAAAVHRLAERRAARLRRSFAQGVSHELRTSLAHVQLYTEMLLLHGDVGEEERRRWLEIVGREALRLSDMVENLLDYAQGADGAAPPAREPVDLGAVLEDVAAACVPLAAAREMRIAADPPAGLTARVDAVALRRAVANLVDNAVRHGHPGQTVTLSLQRCPGGAALAVADQGPGVAPRDRARIWEPFHPAGPTGGMGLGLAAVQRFAAAHAGRVFVEDAPGGGARFGIVLPLADGAGEAARAGGPTR